MMIDSYSFGRIVIEGHEYSSDVIIFPDSVEPSWRRERGHQLSLADLETVISSNPDLLVIGTGSSGRMKVGDDVLAMLEERISRVVVARTGEAVRIFNLEEEGAVAALHLTC